MRSMRSFVVKLLFPGLFAKVSGWLQLQEGSISIRSAIAWNDGSPMADPPQGFTLVQIDFGPKDAGLALAGCENATQRINDHAVAVINGWHQVNAIVPGAHSEDRLSLGSSFLVLESRSPGWRKNDFRPAESKDCLLYTS